MCTKIYNDDYCVDLLGSSEDETVVVKKQRPSVSNNPMIQRVSSE